MAQKFIITRKGIFRMGNVTMHKDLLASGDSCMGGGYYRFDYINMRLILYGRSFDFGEPMWTFLSEHRLTLKIPHAYHNMQITYRRQDDEQETLNISQTFDIDYI